jgi:predicted RNA-binding protein with EMAP domain
VRKWVKRKRLPENSRHHGVKSEASRVRKCKKISEIEDTWSASNLERARKRLERKEMWAVRELENTRDDRKRAEINERAVAVFAGMCGEIVSG